MNFIPTIQAELRQASDILNCFINDPIQIKKIDQASGMIVSSFQNGGKVLSCGNGGSHCDAMHFAEELTGSYRNYRQALPAIAISDSSHLTCTANDYGFEKTFSRFIEGVGRKGDVLLGISTSGKSKNVINAVKTARQKNINTIVLTGKDGGELADLADIEIRVPYFSYADRIQEIHIKIIHILILLIEQKMNIYVS